MANPNDDLWQRLKQPGETPYRLQRAVLSRAKKGKRIVTPAAVVATAGARDGVSWSGARKQLDLIVQQGELEVYATETGVPPWEYVVPELLTESTRRQIVDYRE